MEARLLDPLGSWRKITKKVTVTLCVADSDFRVVDFVCEMATSFSDRAGWGPSVRGKFLLAFREPKTSQQAEELACCPK